MKYVHISNNITISQQSFCLRSHFFKELPLVLGSGLDIVSPMRWKIFFVRATFLNPPWQVSVGDHDRIFTRVVYSVWAERGY